MQGIYFDNYLASEKGWAIITGYIDGSFETQELIFPPNHHSH